VHAEYVDSERDNHGCYGPWDREAFKGSVYVIGEGNHYGCYGKLRVLCGTG